MTYQQPYPMGGTESDSSDEGGVAGALTDRIIALISDRIRRPIQAKRDYIFAESMHGRPEHRKELQAMVKAYAVVLNLVDEVLK